MKKILLHIFLFGAFFCFYQPTLFSQACDCTEFIYLNEPTGGGGVLKFEVNADGSLDDVLQANGDYWYSGSELPSPHGLGVDLNGYLYISEHWDVGVQSEIDIRRLTCDGTVLPENDPANNLSFSYRNGGVFNIVSKGNKIYYNERDELQEEIIEVDICSGLKTGSLPLCGVTENSQDWGLYRDARQDLFYATSNTRLLGTEGDIYVFDESGFDLDDDAADCVTPAFNVFTDSPVTNGIIRGVTTDNVGNIYVVVQRDNAGCASILKYGPGPTYAYLGQSPLDCDDTDGGFGRAIGIVYSETSNLLYTSQEFNTEDCIHAFTTDLVDAGLIIGPTGTANYGKGISITKECCPTSTPQSLSENVCYNGANTTLFLNEIFGCDGGGAICEGQWTNTIPNANISFDECELSITVSGVGCATFSIVKTTSDNGVYQCGPFDISLEICSVLPPTATTSTTDATCSVATNIPNNDAEINLTAITDGDVVGISSAGAAMYDGSDYDAAAAAADLLLVSGANTADFTGLMSASTYIVRVFNAADDCFEDFTVTTEDVSCVVCELSFNNDSPVTLCRTGILSLADLDAEVSPDNLDVEWSTSGDGVFVDNTGTDIGSTAAFATAVSYRPGTADITNGSVTITLSSDAASECGALSASVDIAILNVDCGTFPWGGN